MFTKFFKTDTSIRMKLGSAIILFHFNALLQIWFNKLFDCKKCNAEFVFPFIDSYETFFTYNNDNMRKPIEIPPLIWEIKLFFLIFVLYYNVKIIWLSFIWFWREMSYRSFLHLFNKHFFSQKIYWIFYFPLYINEIFTVYDMPC